MESPPRLVPWGRCRGCRNRFPITELYDRAPSTYVGYCASCFSVYVPVPGNSLPPVEPAQAAETAAHIIRGVYFVQGELSGLIKIGYSTHIVERVRNLQGFSGERLILLGIVKGAQSIERNLHKRFSNYRKHGEWFAPDQTILIYIEQHTEKISGLELLRNIRDL